MIPNHNCLPEQLLEGNEAISKRKSLELIRVDGTRWLTLYRCKDCGLYWEESYDIDKGAYMAGGIPILKQLSADALADKWKIP